MASRENARKFHFLREIASGGFGSVYLAKVMHADGFSRLVAIKLLHRRWSENKEIAQRMRDEARLLGWLRHRNIVDVIDLTSIDGRAAVIMEYLEAVDLKTVVQTLSEKGERIPPYAALEMIAFVASALDAAYNRPPYEGEKPLRVIHRDIKPSNIMVDESGTVKVLDFGVARGEFENRESHTSELQFGSVEYMPPERLFFEPETDRADVYSLGASLFECLSGERLGKAKGRAEKHASFLEDRLSFLAASCPLPNPHGGEMARLVREMCSYNSDNRPKAEEVVTRARQLARQMPGPGLGEWAEVVVKPMVTEARMAPREPNPLTDAVMPEDSTVFGQVEAEAMIEAAKELRAEDPMPLGDIPREDARWEMLRKAAMAEMETLPDLPAGADEDFGDEPTRIGTTLPAAVLAAAIAPASPAPAAAPPKPAASPAKPPSAPLAAGVISAPMPRGAARVAASAPPPEPVPAPAPAPAAAPESVTAPKPAAPASQAPATPTPTLTPAAAPEPSPPAATPPSLPPAAPSANPWPAMPPRGAAAVGAPPGQKPAPPPVNLGPSPFDMLPEIVPGAFDPPSAEELKPHRQTAAPTMVPSDDDVALGLERLRANMTMVPDDVDELPTTAVPTLSRAPEPNLTFPIATGGQFRSDPGEPPPGTSPAPVPAATAEAPPKAPQKIPLPVPKPAEVPASKSASTPRAEPAVAPKAKPKPAPAKAAPAPVRAAPVAPPPDPFADDPPPSSSGSGMMIFGAVMVLGVLGGLALGGLFVGYRYWASSQLVPVEAVSAIPAKVEPVAPVTPEAATMAAPAPAAVGPTDVVFASAATDTKSISAECGGKVASGATEVVVAGPVTGPCLVKLVKKDRSRVMADVTSPAAGKYTCFTADAKSCTK